MIYPQEGEGDALDMCTQYKRMQVLLNVQADLHVVHPFLLSHLEPVDRENKITGLGGKQLIAKQTVYYPEGFFEFLLVQRLQPMY
jgi:hypothetical protein